LDLTALIWEISTFNQEGYLYLAALAYRNPQRIYKGLPDLAVRSYMRLLSKTGFAQEGVSGSKAAEIAKSHGSICLSPSWLGYLLIAKPNKHFREQQVMQTEATASENSK